jgi:hypothetical protein
MTGPVVDDPEHPARRAVGFVPHHLGDEALERSDPGRSFAAAEDLGAVHIPSGEIGPGPAPLVLMLNVHRPPRVRREGRMAPATHLDAGLLVGAQDVVPWAQGQPLPAPLIQIQNPARLGGELGIAQEDPAAMAPWPERILAEPPRVASLICATSPWAIPSRRNSASDQRASGTPRRAGSSHARALTSTTTLGGIAGWAPAPGLLLQPREAFGAKPLAPLADDLAGSIQARGNDVIREAVGGQQHDLRSNDIAIW